MNNPLPDHLNDPLWRRTLTAAERAELDAWLAQHPGALDEFAEEAALTAALERLPDAPVASNFTARVLAEVEREERRSRRRARGSWFAWLRLSGWLPRAAAAGLVFGIVWFGWQQRRVSARVELVRSMAENADVLTPEVVDDFDTIQRLGDAGVDVKLLVALQQ